MIHCPDTRLQSLDSAIKLANEARDKLLAAYAAIQHERVSRKVLEASDLVADVVRAINAVTWEVERDG